MYKQLYEKKYKECLLITDDRGGDEIARLRGWLRKL